MHRWWAELGRGGGRHAKGVHCCTCVLGEGLSHCNIQMVVGGRVWHAKGEQCVVGRGSGIGLVRTGGMSGGFQAVKFLLQ